MIRSASALALLLVLVACPKPTGDASAPPASPSVEEGSEPTKPSKANAPVVVEKSVDQLLQGTKLESLSESEKALALQIATLVKTGEEAQKVMDALKAERQVADDMRTRLDDVEKKLPNAAVIAALEAAKAVPKPPLAERADKLAATISPMLDPVKPKDDASVLEKDLAALLALHQNSAKARITALRVASKALVQIERVRHALPVLERHAAGDVDRAPKAAPTPKDAPKAP